MGDPTYVQELINANPVWKFAYLLSELDNDNAPLGWGGYIRMANSILTFKPEIAEIINEGEFGYDDGN